MRRRFVSTRSCMSQPMFDSSLSTQLPPRLLLFVRVKLSVYGCASARAANATNVATAKKDVFQNVVQDTRVCIVPFTGGPPEAATIRCFWGEDGPLARG